MKPLKVTYVAGSVDINSPDLQFCYIPNMYKGGRAGVGLQVNEGLDHDQTMRLCVAIAEAVCKFNNPEEQDELG